MRKFLAGAFLVAGVLAMSAPAASAAGGTFAGVYPNDAAAKAACEAGRDQGRWTGCTLEVYPDGQIGLWVS